MRMSPVKGNIPLIPKDNCNIFFSPIRLLLETVWEQCNRQVLFLSVLHLFFGKLLHSDKLNAQREKWVRLGKGQTYVNKKLMEICKELSFLNPFKDCI